jgi:hypothetical protein
MGREKTTSLVSKDQDSEFKPHGLNLSVGDVKRIEVMMRLEGSNSASQIVRKCIRMAYRDHFGHDNV